MRPQRLFICLIALAFLAMPGLADPLSEAVKERTLSVEAAGGLALLTDAEYAVVDTFPSYGVALRYRLPHYLGIGIEFEHSQQNGEVTIPTKSQGDLDLTGSIALTAATFLMFVRTPAIGDRLEFSLDLGAGTYMITLDGQGTLEVMHQGTLHEIDYDLQYSIVEPGFSGGVGVDVRLWRGLTLGVFGRVHYILEEEEESDFGAMNFLARLGWMF